MTLVAPSRAGIDALLDRPPSRLGRVGLLANHSAVTAPGEPTVTALRRADADLRVLLGSEHGWSGFEADASPLADGHDPFLDLPVHSLYGPRRRPDPELLRTLDTVVVDVRDVGVRCYTYAATVALLLEAAAEAGTRVVVCDRPNPLGGRVAGPDLDPVLRSFLGYLPVPYRHGLTIGELARLHAATALEDAVDLEVVPAPGWRRDTSFRGARVAPWVPPSPGLPTPESAWLYPGLVLLEGTPWSEGRGTPLPFQVLGAPGVDPYRLADEVRELALPGLWPRPLAFRPESGPLNGRACGGVQLHVHDPDALRPFEDGLRLLARLRERGWLAPTVDAASMPWARDGAAADRAEEPQRGSMLDWLTGSDEARRAIEGRADVDATLAGWRAAGAAFAERCAPHLLYDPPPGPP